MGYYHNAKRNILKNILKFQQKNKILIQKNNLSYKNVKLKKTFFLFD